MNLVAYWRLDEKNDGTVITFKDKGLNSTLVMNPTLESPAYTVASRMNMSEIYLKICPEGSYSKMNTLFGYYECLPCNSLCATCIESNTTSCTSCNSPYVFLKDQMTCVIVTDCEDGLYLDSPLQDSVPRVTSTVQNVNKILPIAVSVSLEGLDNQVVQAV